VDAQQFGLLNSPIKMRNTKVTRKSTNDIIISEFAISSDIDCTKCITSLTALRVVYCACTCMYTVGYITTCHRRRQTSDDHNWSQNHTDISRKLIFVPTSNRQVLATAIHNKPCLLIIAFHSNYSFVCLYING
jgi:hypothetical protein